MAELLSLESSRENLTMAYEQATKDYKNGFACPTCGEELYDDTTTGLLESLPAQKIVCCKTGNCKFTGTRYVANQD